jgi:UDP-glucose 4-epimerase
LKIVVTGALGHIGSKLIRELPKHFQDLELLLIDNFLTQRYCSLFNMPKGTNYRFVECDVTKVDLLPLLDDTSVVIHLAAITDAAGSFEKADLVEQNNFEATKKVAEACLANGVKMIHLSSTSVYGTQKSIVDEDCLEEDLQPQSPYATTKLKEERLISNLVKEKSLKAVTFRFGTIFGVSPGMRFHTAVNKFCWQAAMGLPITVWSTAYEQKRPYLDLDDACRAIAHVIHQDLFTGEVYNALTLNATVREIVESINEFVPDLKVGFVDNPIMNQLSYEISPEKLKSTGYEIAGTLKSKLRDTIELLK